ncbi:cytochrome P450 [Lyophyllum atratum]|nr:cytochrome P450 [Lyophyllum atratum]
MSPFNVMVTVLTVGLKVSGVCLVLLLARGVVGFLNMVLVMPLFDPLRHLPGPKASALQNHFQEIMDPAKTPKTHEDWQKEFGKTFRFHGFGKHDYRMMSFDFRVISHVLNSTTYEKPWQTRALLARLIGRGIFSMEGNEHKVQRRLIGPAFTLQSIKAINPVFLQKARQLCDRWEALISEPFVDAHPTDPPPAYAAVAPAGEQFKGVTIDVAHWTSRASFDVIGLAGFDYNFKALEDESEEVYGAYRRMFDVADKGPRLRGVLELYFPIIRSLWPDNGTKVTNESLRIIGKAGKKLVAAKKATVMAETSKKESQQKDILSLLIKANLSTDPSKRLSDAELLDQCSTFLLAGSDSVSLAMAWCLHFLALNPEIQTRLRNEILSIASAAPSPADDETPDERDSTRATPPPTYSSSNCIHEVWDEIEASPYLDAVVRETLRLCPPVHATIRVATADDQIPVSHPVVLQDGTVVEAGGFVSIRKGSYIHIPIEGLNLSTEIWGSDALEFNPDRWTSLPSSARSPAHPGLGNMMTFGMGPHSCLGYKFSVNEMKAFLATMLPQFVFSPAADISKFNAILTRPYITNKWELGTQLPLVVGRYTA